MIGPLVVQRFLGEHTFRRGAPQLLVRQTTVLFALVAREGVRRGGSHTSIAIGKPSEQVADCVVDQKVVQ
jgi:hypothetical protein